MKTTIFASLVGFLVVVALPFGAPVRADERDAEKERLQGTWLAASAENGGVAYTEADVKKMKVVIEGDRYTYQGINRTSWTLTLDATKEPKQIDLVCTDDGKFKGTVCRGIYILDGDTLLLCINSRGTGDRPKAFQTRGNFGFTCYTLKRQQP